MSNRTRKEINRTNKSFGTSVERQVSKLLQSFGLDADRTPGSGAFKQSNRNLTGDVEVNAADGAGLVKIECKGTSIISPKGEKSFTFKKRVADQAFAEAVAADEIPVLWIHWKNGEYLEDAVAVPGDVTQGELTPILPARLFVELLRLAALGAAVDRNGEQT